MDGRQLRGIKGSQAIKSFIRAGGVERPGGKGDHVNIKMPNGMIITIPGRNKELKIGLLKASIRRAGLTEKEFSKFL
ncbi:MAG: type II toxin-antitoxin system HicA family toxin [Planctomycetota bacterium]|nr:type II toxin-antitoxin system HicA family toxin [Planctomycetota bacterium]MDI6788825.1 type II toxin-antitoxin system HicA family toxin [Planctomycetota bacterium]